MIHPARLKHLVDRPPRVGKYVLYWMQQSQRSRCNHALEYAIARGNELRLPVIVGFGLMDDYPEANARHYQFMLQGLAEVGANLGQCGIRFVARRGHPAEVASELAGEAALVVADRGYLRHQKAWRQRVAQECEKHGCPLVQVEGDAVVPVEVASNKREWAARTIRPKIQRHLKEFLVPLKPLKAGISSLKMRVAGDIDWALPDRVFESLKVDRSVPPVERFFIGGENEARKRLSQFVQKRLATYAESRNEPAADHTSHLSPYLHFGQISPIEVALAVSQKGGADADVFIEEMVVRRELSINYCEFTEDYDSYDALPAWARQTLKEHAEDPRPALYTREQLESAQTADPYWNAAQTEMRLTGYMHNYMRMYWGKKIIEWSRTPQEAYATALALNNRWFLDGRDPNSFTSVAWLFGLHDRPWGPARPVFGTVRYMASSGLERKFDMAAYVARVDALHGR